MPELSEIAIRPNLFIVGAPKCATSSMAYYLGQHPEIYFSKQKELHYFGSDLNSKRRVGGAYSLERYLSFFSNVDNKKHIGEASVLYLYSKNAAREIKAFSPDAKIIIMLRNPVDMMYALHSQLLSQADEDIVCFEEALAAEPFRARGEMVPERVGYIDDGLLYREVSKFTEQVNRYYEVFGRDNVHISLYDDILSNIQNEYRAILKFIGVGDFNFLPDFVIVNGNKETRSVVLQKLLRYPPTWILKITKLFVPRNIAISLRSKLIGANIKYGARRPLDNKLRSELTKEFELEILNLGRLINRDLSHWAKVQD